MSINIMFMFENIIHL